MTRPWTDDEMERTLRLYAAGSSTWEIARILDRTLGAINRRLKAMARGEPSPEWRARLTLTRRARANLVGPENERQPWTPDCDRYLAELWHQGLPDEAIGRSMHRTLQSVQRRRSRLGLSRQPWRQTGHSPVTDTVSSLLNFAVSGRWGR